MDHPAEPPFTKQMIDDVEQLTLRAKDIALDANEGLAVQKIVELIEGGVDSDADKEFLAADFHFFECLTHWMLTSLVRQTEPQSVINLDLTGVQSVMLEGGIPDQAIADASSRWELFVQACAKADNVADRQSILEWRKARAEAWCLWCHPIMDHQTDVVSAFVIIVAATFVGVLRGPTTRRKFAVLDPNDLN